MPLSISEIHRRFIEYVENPMQFLDMSSLEEFDEGRCLIKVKTLEEHLEIYKVGSGARAKVYDIGNNRVLKVTSPGKRDHAYEAYVEACKANPSNPHFPKIFYTGTWANHRVFVLEKLLNLPDNSRHMVADFVQDAARGYTTSPDPMLNPAMFGPTMIEACTIIRSLNRPLDLHAQNIMMREDSTLVITDPVID